MLNITIKRKKWITGIRNMHIKKLYKKIWNFRKDKTTLSNFYRDKISLSFSKFVNVLSLLWISENDRLEVIWTVIVRNRVADMRMELWYRNTKSFRGGLEFCVFRFPREIAARVFGTATTRRNKLKRVRNPLLGKQTLSPRYSLSWSYN